MKFTTSEALFHKAGGKRTGLPSWCYNNAELTQLEMEEVFSKTGYGLAMFRTSRVTSPPLDILGHVPGYRDNAVSGHD